MGLDERKERQIILLFVRNVFRLAIKTVVAIRLLMSGGPRKEDRGLRDLLFCARSAKAEHVDRACMLQRTIVKSLLLCRALTGHRRRNHGDRRPKP